MGVRIKKYLYDVIISIESIQDFVKDWDTFDEFLIDRKLRRAVERELQIIGEAIKKALDIDGNLPITNARKMIGLRNIVVHSYDDMEYLFIWNVIQNHIQVLYIEAKEMLENMPK